MSEKSPQSVGIQDSGYSSSHFYSEIICMECRAACGACCIAPSITSPLPGMPNGKPAGVPCVHLDEQLKCCLFGKPERPSFCGSLQPSFEMCGNFREDAIRFLERLEAETAPE